MIHSRFAPVVNYRPAPMRPILQFAQASSTNSSRQQYPDFDDPWITEGVSCGASSIHGRGLFAARAIPRGERVMVLNGLLFTVDELKEGVVREDSATGFCEGVYVGSPSSRPPSVDEYLNHSCDPNLWLLDELTIVARRDIACGEELTFDYSTWEIDQNWHLPGRCNCGSGTCRKIVTGRDWRMRGLQRKYDTHFLPCLAERIRFKRAARESVLLRSLDSLALFVRRTIKALHLLSINRPHGSRGLGDTKSPLIIPAE